MVTRFGDERDKRTTASESAVEAGGRNEIPVRDPLADLTPASRRIVAAAAGLLTSAGPKSVTMERVAREAKVNKWTIRNNFGGKAALLGAAADYFLHDQCVRLVKELSGLPPEERARHIARGMRRMITETDARGYFNVLPLALADDALRAQFVSLYEWWYAQNLRWLGYEACSGTPPSDAEMRIRRGTAHLMTALVDGLWLQAAIHRDDVDLDSAFEALALLLARGLDAATADGHDAKGLPDR